MTPVPALELSPLIRQLREAAGLTQAELAERVGTTQSVISRLESDDYEGHSLSMLNRIGAALNCRLTVGLTPERSEMATVRESAPRYGAGAAPTSGASDRSLSRGELDRIAERLAQRFQQQGVTKADVKEALRWARGAGEGSAEGSAEGSDLRRLRGAIKVGAGSTVDDVRRARAQRGRDIARAQ